MQLNNAVQKTFSKTLECIYLLVFFILADVFLSLPIKLPTIEKTTTIVLVSYIQVIIGTPIQMFIYAGLHGLIFLKINSQRIGTHNFFKLSISNFWGFLKIAIVVIVIGSFLWRVLEISLTSLLSENYPSQIITYPYRILSLIIEALFTFSYPLVILGHFAKRNLKPIRTSLSLIFKYVKEIKFIFIVLLLKLLLSSLGWLLGIQATDTISLLLLPLYTFLTFLLIVYAYLKLTKCFLKDLVFNFRD